jgi:hypothetical protein
VLADFYASVPREDYRFYCPHPLDAAHARQKAARADDPNFVCVVAEGPPHAVTPKFPSLFDGCRSDGVGENR